MGRILMAALVGGVIVFMWGFFSHTVLPIGEMGLSTLPNEDAVLASLESQLPEAGLYIFPSEGLGGELTGTQMKEWERKYQTGPAGLLAYRPIGGTQAFEPKRLIVELLSNIFACFVAASLLAMIVGGYGRRVLATALLGAFAWLSISISQYNWYGFTSMYALAEGIDQVVSFALAGLAIAKLVPPPA